MGYRGSTHRAKQFELQSNEGTSESAMDLLGTLHLGRRFDHAFRWVHLAVLGSGDRLHASFPRWWRAESRSATPGILQNRPDGDTVVSAENLRRPAADMFDLGRRKRWRHAADRTFRSQCE